MLWGLRLSCVCLIILCSTKIVDSESEEFCKDKCICDVPNVDCSNLNLTRVPQDLPAWTLHLDLSGNFISNVSVGDFSRIINATSINLNNNRISVLEAGCFSGLHNLVNLKLSKNRLTNFTKGLFSADLGRLKHLDLSKNKLTTIEGLAFKNLKSLTALKLRRNKITKLNDGAFYGLANLRELRLNGNSITKLSNKWLYRLGSLEELSLEHNAIADVRPEDLQQWQFCPDLRVLRLSRNKLTRLRSNVFVGLSKRLSSLLLDHNNITDIEEDAFADLRHLKVLDLSHNSLSSTLEDSASSLKGSLSQLSKLNLAGNTIRSVDSNMVSQLLSLRTLDLRGNGVTSIQDDAFVSLVNLEHLYINSSSMVCNCYLSSFRQWLISQPFEQYVGASCGFPLEFKGTPVVNVPAEKFTCEETPKPNLKKSPISQQVLKGSDLNLTCSAAVTGDSDLTITWKKNSKEIKGAATDEWTNTTEDGVTTVESRLLLSNVDDSAEGNYQCIVSNIIGSAYSHKAVIKVHVFPTFKVTPNDVTVRAGSNARLVCAARGDPKPTISLQKDGGDDFPAARERRLHVMPTDDVFFIMSVTAEDQGRYSCTAKNDAGSIVANANLTVLENPSFVKPLEDHTVKVGETTVLECMAAGLPLPRLRWLKDGSELMPTERHFFTAEGQLLVIVEMQPTDSGVYTCELKNTLGTERDTCVLTVIDDSSPGQRSDSSSSGGDLNSSQTTTGIIIIAVVCCVVGTSLVWVIIIYQTRRRNDEYQSTHTDETTLPPDLPSSFQLSSGSGSLSADQQDSTSSNSYLQEEHLPMVMPCSSPMVCYRPMNQLSGNSEQSGYYASSENLACSELPSPSANTTFHCDDFSVDPDILTEANVVRHCSRSQLPRRLNSGDDFQPNISVLDMYFGREPIACSIQPDNNNGGAIQLNNEASPARRPVSLGDGMAPETRDSETRSLPRCVANDLPNR